MYHDLPRRPLTKPPGLISRDQELSPVFFAETGSRLATTSSLGLSPQASSLGIIISSFKLSESLVKIINALHNLVSS